MCRNHNIIKLPLQRFERITFTCEGAKSEPKAPFHNDTFILYKLMPKTTPPTAAKPNVLPFSALSPGVGRLLDGVAQNSTSSTTTSTAPPNPARKDQVKGVRVDWQTALSALQANYNNDGFSGPRSALSSLQADHYSQQARPKAPQNNQTATQNTPDTSTVAALLEQQKYWKQVPSIPPLLRQAMLKDINALLRSHAATQGTPGTSTAAAVRKQQQVQQAHDGTGTPHDLRARQNTEHAQSSNADNGLYANTNRRLETQNRTHSSDLPAYASPRGTTKWRAMDEGPNPQQQPQAEPAASTQAAYDRHQNKLQKLNARLVSTINTSHTLGGTSPSAFKKPQGKQKQQSMQR